MYYFNHSPIKQQTTKLDRVNERNFDRNFYMAKRLKRQDNKCFFCGNAIDMSGHLDHLNPIYNGGKSTLSNLFATCHNCNLTKGTDQIIILNKDTIKFYINLKNEFSKWVGQKRKLGSSKPNSYVRQYWIYRADLFLKVSGTPKMKER